MTYAEINRSDHEQDQRLSLLEYRMEEAEKKITALSESANSLRLATEKMLGIVDTQKTWIFAINAVTVLAIIGAIVKSVWG